MLSMLFRRLRCLVLLSLASCLRADVGVGEGTTGEGSSTTSEGSEGSTQAEGVRRRECGGWGRVPERGERAMSGGCWAALNWDKRMNFQQRIAGG